MPPDGRSGASRKGLIVILDGLGDRPSAALDGRTPLEAANTPNLDALAGAGQWGFVEPVPEGQNAHTHLGVGLLFGLEPTEAGCLERGPIEAAGLDHEPHPGELVIRTNFATLETAGEGWLIRDRRAGRIDAGASELAVALQGLEFDEGVRVAFRRTQQHRGTLSISGPDLSVQVSDTDPGNVPLPAPMPPCEALSEDEAARRTAGLINRYTALSHSVLKDHPVNRDRRKAGLPPATGLICRGAGIMPQRLRAIGRDQLRVAVVAGCSTVVGLTRLMEFDVVSDAKFSADVNTDLDAKIRAALDALSDHDLVYIHVKAPDICAHDRDPVAKQHILQRIDQALLPLLDQEIVIGVCADHGTDSNTGWHIDDPVPGLLCDRSPGIRDARPNFGERVCMNGPMGQIGGHQFLQRALTAMGVNTA